MELSFITDANYKRMNEIMEQFKATPGMTLYAYTEDGTILQIDHCVSTRQGKPLPGDDVTLTMVIGYDETKEADTDDNGLILQSHPAKLDVVLNSLDIDLDLRIWEVANNT